MVSSGLRWRPVADSREHGNEPSFFPYNAENFLSGGATVDV
jgi:hypothetical protein